VLALAGAAAVVFMPSAGKAARLDGLVDALRAESWVTEVSHSGSRIRVAVREEGHASRALVGLVASHEIALVRLDRQRPTLEDVFLELTARDDRGRAA